ncbi:MAG: Xaa-Pro peptidase family protein [Alphaproteobacteria bacterium]|nr:Xaa-Pro peptidase family protein [Alphaproteobacteria bacterium]MBU1563246.1 Xaa-Pro peptidase family protein [Alphaproteobacteria bacterium]MBU2303353.1 Xaa-Pro peptidase family protein [Alphaproteobacteria bacterium]MBU2368601.1 Xaa-Pro peptidase family protein [Alphaproteobacteria bacterium]
MNPTLTTRLANLRARMAETGTDLVVIGPSSHMLYLADLSPHGDERPVLLMVSPTFAGFLMPALNVDSARQHTDLPFFPWADADGPDAALKDLLSATGVPASPSIVLDETMRTDFALLVLDALPGARRRFTQDTVGYLRSRKDDAEYDALKKSAVLNDAAMAAGFAALRPGITEYEVATVIRDFYKAHGATTEFCSVCFGPNGAFPHHHTGDTRLKDRDAVLIDTGGRIHGYPSDMTRVGYFGSKPQGFEEIHAILDRAVTAAIAAARPGVPASAVDKAARDVITEAGYGPNFLHRTGHGLGIDVHETPYITATSPTVLEEGMVFSIEPGIYLQGRFGLRLEEIVIIRNGKAEILSEMPRTAIAGG